MTGILNILAGSIAAAIKDGYFNLVTLLLPGNGTNGAQNNTFLDSSSNNFSITRNGNTTQGTFSPFSQTGWSGYFNGTTDYLLGGNSADYTLGTGDYSIEFWMNASSTSGSTGVMGFGGAVNGVATVFINAASGTANIRMNASGGTAVTTANNAWSANQWTHVVITRASGFCRIFVNGVLQAYAAFSDNLGGADLSIGRSYYNLNQEYFTGYLSNVRLVKGSVPTAYQTSVTATGTAVFTPPTAALTDVTNTKLLTLQSNRFVDTNTQVAAKTITVNGSPSVQAFSPFAPTAAYSAATNGGSGYFDGNGDYLSIANTANLQFGSGDFTLEFFVYFNALSGNQTIYDKGYTGTNAFVIQTNTNTGTMIVYANGTAIITASSASPVGQWDHYAVVRSGTTITLYRNGVSVGSATNSVNFNNAAVTNIGAGLNQTNSTYTAFANAYISNVRLVKGSAVYTAPFTPPTAPHTAITNTQLLLNFTNGGIVDATGKNVLETVGNAQISTTQSKFGGSSMYFDGTGDWLFSKGGNNRYDFGTGDFTMECWFYPTTTPSMAGLLSTGNNTAWGCVWLYTTSTAIYCRATASSSGQDVGITGGTFNTNAWNHAAIVRSGTTFSLYLNGSRVATTTSSTALKTNCDLVVGGVYESSTAGSPFTGYIDDARISLYARYSGATYTQPTAAFPTQ
jgi:hypothetical protein